MFWPHISLSSRDGCRNTAVNVPTDYTDYSKHIRIILLEA